MARKFLNELGLNDIIMELSPEDKRWDAWKKEKEIFGFSSYETRCLDLHFYCWLYERLKMFLEVNNIDLSYHKFDFEDKEYTQGELIDKMLYGCELALLEEFKRKNLTEDEQKAINDVRWIWATVMPVMWW